MPETITRSEAAFMMFLDSIRHRTYVMQQFGEATLKAREELIKFSEVVSRLYKPKLIDRIRNIFS